MLAPRKSLGQNFLRDENIARKIVESLRIKPRDIILEIGPGQGDLTKFLLEGSSTVVGVELDPRAAHLLQERFGARLRLLEADILTLNLENIAEQYGRRPCIVGNIPYYITSDILFWVFDQRVWITHATLMMQLEVATRLVARPGTKAYGILSVFSQLFADTQLLFKVSRNSFHPRPQVDSAVVRFEFQKPSPETDERFLRNIVRRSFGARRKTLKNSLKMMGFADHQLDRVAFDLSQRPEQLTPSDFVRLSALLRPLSQTIPLKF